MKYNKSDFEQFEMSFPNQLFEKCKEVNVNKTIDEYISRYKKLVETCMHYDMKIRLSMIEYDIESFLKNLERLQELCDDMSVFYTRYRQRNPVEEKFWSYNVYSDLFYKIKKNTDDYPIQFIERIYKKYDSDNEDEIKYKITTIIKNTSLKDGIVSYQYFNDLNQRIYYDCVIDAYFGSKKVFFDSLLKYINCEMDDILIVHTKKMWETESFFNEYLKYKKWNHYIQKFKRNYYSKSNNGYLHEAFIRPIKHEEDMNNEELNSKLIITTCYQASLSNLQCAPINSRPDLYLFSDGKKYMIAHVTTKKDCVPFKEAKCDVKYIRPVKSMEDQAKKIVREMSLEFRSSSLERITAKHLNSLNIKYKREYKCGCKDINELPYDFYFKYKGHKVLLELDGSQHFVEVKHWGGKQGLITRQRHDKLKNDFAAANGYKLLRIRYDENIPEKINMFLDGIGESSIA